MTHQYATVPLFFMAKNQWENVRTWVSAENFQGEGGTMGREGKNVHMKVTFKYKFSNLNLLVYSSLALQMPNCKVES